MKKIILSTFFSIIFVCASEAQIKVVGDDYTATMTGSKKYYDHDVDFDKIFPRWEMNGSLYPDLSSYYKSNGYSMPNLLGDTIYLSKPLYEKPQPNRITVNESFIYIYKGDSRFSVAPVGYYTIDGYIFCTDNADSITSSMNLNLSFFDFKERTSWHLKEEILRYQDRFSSSDLRKYQICCVLKSTTDSICVYAHTSYFRDIDACMLKFYNEAIRFIGKKVVITSGYHKDWDLQCFYRAPFTNYEKLNIVCDALTQNILRLEDAEYIVSDVVLKDGVLYAIFAGTKTGTFSMEISRLIYAYSAEDIDEDYVFAEERGNKNGDVVCMEFRCPGNKKGSDDSCNGVFYIMASDQLGVLERRSKLAQAQKDNEYKRAKIQREREKKNQEETFKRKMIAKYGNTLGSIVGKKQVSIGMTTDMCKDAWGQPMNTYRTTTKYGQSEVWCYNYKTRVYFYNNKVVQIDD